MFKNQLLLPIIVTAIVSFTIGIFSSNSFLRIFHSPTFVTEGVRPFNEAIEMIDTFRLIPCNDTITNSGYIHLENLENYLLFIKRISAANHTDLLGLQYYFSRYTRNTAIDPSHIGHKTLVFFPVVNESGIRIVKDIKRDIDVEEFLKNPGNRQLILNQKSGLDTSLITAPNSTAFNMSQMSPPRPPGGN